MQAVVKKPTGPFQNTLCMKDIRVPVLQEIDFNFLVNNLCNLASFLDIYLHHSFIPPEIILPEPFCQRVILGSYKA